MNISPVSFRNSFAVKNKINQNKQFAKNLAIDSVSFGAIIPKNLSPKRKTLKSRSIQAIDPGNGNNFLHYSKTREDVDFVAKKLGIRKGVLKKMLLQENKYGNIPISTANLEAAKRMIELSPDKKTLKKQLLARAPYNNPMMVARKENDDFREYLFMSPDDETFMKQLYAERESAISYAPVIEHLSFGSITDVLNKIKSVQLKKEILFSSWKYHVKGGFLNPIEYEHNVVTSIRESLNTSIRNFGTRSIEADCAKFGKVLVQIIRDSSTTDEEAIKLIQMYKEFTDSQTYECLEKIAQRILNK